MRASVLLILLLAGPAGANECVVLLHGLARSASSMETMAAALAATAFHPVNIDYPSQDFPIEDLADEAIPRGLQGCGPRQTIHFVTHSMGGILVRQYLSMHTIPQLGRVVMLGPPNQGSEVVDELGDWALFEWLNGAAGQQLGTGVDSVPLQLGPATFDVGIIAGTHSINLLLSQLIPGQDDGKVAVRNAKLMGMSDFITVPVSHPFLMMDDQVIAQTIHFLQHGRFARPDREP